MKKTNDPTVPAPAGSLQHLAIDRIEASASNPRKHFDQAKLDELAASIKTQGVRIPLLVRPLWPSTAKNAQEADVSRALDLAPERYELVDGERRLRAAHSLRLGAVPCIVQVLTDAEVREIQLLSFVREELSALEAAKGYQNLIDRCGYTAETLRARLGLAKATFYARMSVLKAVPAVQVALAKGTVSQSHAQLLASVPAAADQARLLKDIVEREWSVRELEEEIKREYLCDLEKAAFSAVTTYASALRPEPCGDCPQRGANAKEHFPSLALRPNACLNGACFKSKTRAHQQQAGAQLVAQGFEVLTPEESLKAFPRSYSDDPCGPYCRLTEWFTTNKGHQHANKLLPSLNKLKPLKAWHPDGKTRDVWRRADLLAALAAKGITPEEYREVKPATPEQKAKEEFARRVELLTTEKTALATLAAFERDEAAGLRAYILGREDYNQALKLALERRGHGDKKKSWPAALAKMKTPALCALLVEYELRAYGGRWNGRAVDDLAAELKIDVKALRKAATAELEAAEAKKAPAAVVAPKAKTVKGKAKK